ncbi:MAG: MGMT family protein [Candidatus Ancillula sp.]|jgi:methylated-DNA-[protein]-cysteine S-methyltransferase|nr:MGMT family protein [Candidatus Ancillula sp.]
MATESPNFEYQQILECVDNFQDFYFSVDVLSCIFTNLSDFSSKVLSQISKIQRGNVISYCNIAREVGAPNASRAVGSICRRNPLPLIIPCHRVVPKRFLTSRKIEDIGSYAYGGSNLKAMLLRKEGVVFE